MISTSIVKLKSLNKYAAAALAFGAVVFAHPSHAEEAAPATDLVVNEPVRWMNC